MGIVTKPVGCIFKSCLTAIIMALLPLIIVVVLVWANLGMVDTWIHQGRVEIYGHLFAATAGQVAPDANLTSQITLKAVKDTCNGKEDWILEVRYPIDSPTAFDASEPIFYNFVGSRVTDFDVRCVSLIGLDAKASPLRAVSARTTDIVALVKGTQTTKVFLTHVKKLSLPPA